MKVPFGLAQAPAYFQELMTGILKDFNFTIAYPDDIIIFSKNPSGAPLTHQNGLPKTQISQPFHEKEQMQLLFQRDPVSRTHPTHATGIRPLPSKTHAIQHMQPPTTPKQV